MGRYWSYHIGLLGYDKGSTHPHGLYSKQTSPFSPYFLRRYRENEVPLDTPIESTLIYYPRLSSGGVVLSYLRAV